MTTSQDWTERWPPTQTVYQEVKRVVDFEHLPLATMSAAKIKRRMLTQRTVRSNVAVPRAWRS